MQRYKIPLFFVIISVMVSPLFGETTPFPSLSYQKIWDADPSPPGVNNGLFSFTIQNKNAYTTFAGFTKRADEPKSIVVLSDSTRWEVDWDEYFEYLHQMQLHSYQPEAYPIMESGDRIIVTPSLNPFDMYKYQLRNVDKGIIWSVNLISMTKEQYGGEIFVTKKNLSDDEIFLSDNSLTKVSLVGLSQMRKWEDFDPVAIGVNRGPQSLFFPHILIHLPSGEYIDTKFICY